VSIAKDVKWYCEHIAKDGFSLSRGVLWQHKRVNARAFPFKRGRLIAERRDEPSGFQTDALHLYADGSMLIVNRTVYKTKLAATKGELR
jgi:hypothetical protein